MKKRLNVGLIINDLEDDFAVAVTKGAHLAAVDADVNLAIFAGRFKSAKEKQALDWFSQQYNSIYSYPCRENLDLLIVSLGTIFHFFDEQVIKEFFEKYEGIPIVTIAIEYPGKSCVMFDQSPGLEAVMEHLICDHGCRNIGFVAGPLDNADSNKRIETYKSMLEKHNISVCDENIVHGDFSEYGYEPIDRFIDKFGKKLDAVCCANDTMASLVMRALVRNGLTPGKDVAVTGYDNSIEAAASEPPLTTVSASATTLGYKAVFEALRLLETGEVRTVKLNSKAVIRESCGCSFSPIDSENKQMCIKCHFEDKIDRWFESCGKSDENIVLLKIFRKDVYDILWAMKSVAEGVSEDGIKRAETIFKTVLLPQSDDAESIAELRDFVGALCRSAVRYSENNECKSNIYNLQLRFLNSINDAMAALNYEVVSALRRNAIFLTNIVSVSSDDFVEKYARMLMQIEKLGISRSCFYLLDTPQKIVDPFKESVFEQFSLRAYNTGKDYYALPAGEIVIKRSGLLSNPFISGDKRMTLSLSPLFSTHEHYGLLVCELPPKQFSYIQAVSRQVSTVLETDSLLLQINYQLDEEQARNKVLKNIATRDELTGVYNRRGFFEVMERIVRHSENIGRRAVLMFTDVDNLKVINDQYSHEEGDVAIRLVADALKESFETGSIVGRLGGDEFLSFMTVGEDQSASGIYATFKNKLSRMSDELDKPYRVSASVGIVEFCCGEDVDISSVIDSADKLLYIDKQKKQSVSGI